ncbi:hypothetical protein EVAR_61771_1 [Eumeta japonica]|uniref:Uncharacterized protein n=1 Tax=Eumeta variegata TaxID=151549 RepID=A0A4C1Z2J5_EUMVA|nr:hypothetical protein EVAR_61771_1 [Eumeta japonica]
MLPLQWSQPLAIPKSHGGQQACVQHDLSPSSEIKCPWVRVRRVRLKNYFSMGFAVALNFCEKREFTDVDASYHRQQDFDVFDGRAVWKRFRRFFMSERGNYY